jgi:hypothetical protein
MKRFAREIVIYTAGEFIAMRLETWARRASADRRAAWARSVRAERDLRIEGLFRAVNPFTRRKRSSAEIIAANVLGRRKATWKPF